MMTILLFGLFVVTLLAAAAETLSGIAGDLFASLCREPAANEALRKAKAKVTETEKKAASLLESLPPVRRELARAESALADVEREISDRQKAPDLVVLPAGPAGDMRDPRTRRFRAPVTKRLGAGAEQCQTQLWQKTCVLEVTAQSAAEATLLAQGQFTANAGYAIGKFSEVGTAPVPVPAAPKSGVAA